LLVLQKKLNKKKWKESGKTYPVAMERTSKLALKKKRGKGIPRKPLTFKSKIEIMEDFS